MLRNLRLKQKNGLLIKITYNYMEQDSTKSRVVLVKTTPFLCKNYVIHKINTEARVKYIIPSLF